MTWYVNQIDLFSSFFFNYIFPIFMCLTIMVRCLYTCSRDMIGWDASSSYAIVMLVICNTTVIVICKLIYLTRSNPKGLALLLCLLGKTWNVKRCIDIHKVTVNYIKLYVLVLRKRRTFITFLACVPDRLSHEMKFSRVMYITFGIFS